MKNIILISAIGIFIQSISSNDEILSKFHQNGYKIKDFEMRLISYDHDTYNFLELKSFKYNRTTRAHNFTLNVKVDAKDKTEILVQVYKFLSNEYRHFPIRFQLNLKKTVDSNAIGLLTQVRKCGNMTTFYFYKDITYHLCNFLIDEKRFPPLIPSGKYKLEITMFYLDKEVSLMHFFCEIYTPIPIPKN